MEHTGNSITSVNVNWKSIFTMKAVLRKVKCSKNVLRVYIISLILWHKYEKEKCII